MYWGLSETSLHICITASDKHVVIMTEEEIAVAGFLSLPCWFPPKGKFYAMLPSAFDSKPWFRNNISAF